MKTDKKKEKGQNVALGNIKLVVFFRLVNRNSRDPVTQHISCNAGFYGKSFLLNTFPDSAEKGPDIFVLGKMVDPFYGGQNI